MKKFIYIYSLFFIVACAKQGKNEAPVEQDMKEYEIGNENSAFVDISEEFTYQHLTKQKLQDYFDLLVLQQEHPEFETTIALQLQELSNDTLKFSNVLHKISIENVQQIGATIKISDSIQKIRLLFDMVAEGSKKIDSITAIVSTKMVYLDQKEVISTKVVFEK